MPRADAKSRRGGFAGRAAVAGDDDVVSDQVSSASSPAFGSIGKCECHSGVTWTVTSFAVTSKSSDTSCWYGHASRPSETPSFDAKRRPDKSAESASKRACS
jgi:hypothetical protein